MMTLLPLMTVPLLVWVAVWTYLWNLDGKVKRLQQEVVRVRDSRNDQDL